MFTSRAEYRLLLRHDNADLRLSELGYKLGLVPEAWYAKCERKKASIQREVNRLNETRPALSEAVRARMEEAQMPPISPNQSLAHVLRRQDMTYRNIQNVFSPDTPISLEADLIEAIEIEIKYEGYIKREIQQVQKSRRLENRMIPAHFDYDVIPGFSREVREKLKKIRPASIGQASRISGITPAAISLLLVGLEKHHRMGSPSLSA